MTNVVGLTGKAGAGKSVAAEAFEDLGYKRVKFSAPLKNMLREFFRTCGLSEYEIERRIEGDLKEVEDELLCGKTPRFAMQTLGNEWGRVIIGKSIWSNAWRAKAEQEIAEGNSVVAEDVRFDTEDFEIHRLNGKIVEIFGRQKDSVNPTHASELFDGVNPDIRIKNEGSIEALKGAMNYVFRSPDDQEVSI